MPRRALTFADVRAMGRAIPGVEEGTAYGSPALKRNGELLACIATNKQAEPNTLAVRLGFDDRDELIENDPDTYYLKDHYVDYGCVLVRLSRVHPDALRDLLLASARYLDTKTRRTRKRTPKRRRA